MMPYLQLVSSTQSLPPPDLIQAYTGWPGDSCWGVDSVDIIDSVDSDLVSEVLQRVLHGLLPAHAVVPHVLHRDDAASSLQPAWEYLIMAVYCVVYKPEYP